MGKKIFWIFGGASGVVFLVLLGIRMELFKGLEPMNSIDPPAFKTSLEKTAAETWMDIFLNNQKIGYTRRVLEIHETGFKFSDRSYLKMNIMGMPGDVFMETTGSFLSDYSLSGFDFNMSSGALNFSAKGRIKDHVLEMKTRDQTIKIPLEEPVYLSGAIMSFLKAMDLSRGKTAEFQIFDPLSGRKEKVSVRLEGVEPVDITGKSMPSRKIFLEYKGFAQYAWLDESGEVIQESGPMGLLLVKTTKQEALSEFQVAGMEDLTESVSIPSNRMITRPEENPSLAIRVSGMTNPLGLDGGRQTYQDNLLTIIKEDPGNLPRQSDPEAEKFLDPSPNIQSDHPEIKTLVSDLVSDVPSDLEKARILVDWVYENIEKKPVISIPDALTTLKTRKGDCNEHAALLAAMARAAGIPAQMEAGLVYLKGRFYYHAWNVLYMGAWVTADGALGQFPADVTHIRLIRGGLESQGNLVRAMGKIQLEILND